LYGRGNSENSLDNVFDDSVEEGPLAGTAKSKKNLGGSANHMSLMSLTVSELDENESETNGQPGDLSAMFDSSMQISDNKRTASVVPANATSAGGGVGNIMERTNSGTEGFRRKSQDDAKLLDMSVATIGNDMSTVGGLSSTVGAGEVEDSAAHMSFSNMFDESDKNNV